MQLGVPAQVNGGAGRAGCVRTHPCQLRGVVPTWRSPSIGPLATGGRQLLSLLRGCAYYLKMLGADRA